MAGTILKQIAALVRAGRLDNAADLARSELRENTDPRQRPHIITALCLALTGSGRTSAAAAAYEEFRDELFAAGKNFYVTAAIAARHTADLRRFFARSRAYAGQAISVSRLSSSADWCAHRGLSATEIDMPQHIVLPDATTYVTDPFRCFRIPSAEMLCGWDFVFTSDGQILADTGYYPLGTLYGAFPCAVAENAKLAAHIWPEEVEEISADALFLSAPRAFHVGHFIVDFLPRLRCLAKFSPDLKVAFPREAPAKFTDLLTHFGLTKDKMVLCDLGKRYRFASLVVAQHGDYLRPNPATVKFVRDALFKAAPRPPTRRIFLERDVGSRQIANRTKFDALIAEMHFERVNLAALSIAEQRALFSEARVMLGVFGSDLLCSYFAPRGASMIELTWDPGQASVIAPTCHLLGIRHHYFTCHEAPVTKLKRFNKDRDITVDCDELRSLLKRLV